uniref:Polyprotein protein n=1 Tax=Solanum tuberosum TaxID=4113 RepID=M1DVI0_SOLTU
MGQLTLYVDCRAASLEAFIPGMIHIAITNAITPLSTTIVALVARIAVCEHNQRATEEILDMPDLPQKINELEGRAKQIADHESDENINEEIEGDAYEDFIDMEEIMIDVVVQASLAKFSAARSSGAGLSGGHSGYRCPNR